jgi:hypothetical protein
MKVILTLRQQLKNAKDAEWRYRKALQAILAGEVTWGEWQEYPSWDRTSNYYVRDGKADDIVIHHTRYTQCLQAGGSASIKPRANGYWENVEVTQDGQI